MAFTLSKRRYQELVDPLIIDKLIVGPSDYFMTIKTDGTLWYGTIYNGLEKIGTFNNVVDGFVGNNDSSYLLTEHGYLYYINTDGTTELLDGIEKVSKIIPTSTSEYFHVESNGETYKVTSSNKEVVRHDFEKANYSSYKDIVSYNYDHYAFINSEDVLCWYSHIEGQWKYIEICDATNVVDIFVTNNNMYYVTSNGEVYAVGSSSNNALTNIYGSDTLAPVEILFGNVSTEKPLSQNENNISKIKTFNKGKIIEFTYNQKLFVNNLNRIVLQDSEGNSVAISVKLNNNKVI